MDKEYKLWKEKSSQEVYDRTHKNDHVKGKQDHKHQNDNDIEMSQSLAL